MPINVVYKCSKCGQVLTDYKPIRLTQYKYNEGPGYKQYLYAGMKYDLCKRCYTIFKRWINKQNVSDSEK